MSRSDLAQTLALGVVSSILSCPSIPRSDWVYRYVTLTSGATISFKHPCKEDLVLCLSDMAKVILECRYKRIWIDLTFSCKNIEVLDVLIELDMTDMDSEMWKMLKDQFVLFLVKIQQQLLKLDVQKPLSVCVRNEKPQVDGDVLYVDSFYSSLKVPSISVVFIGVDKSE